MANAEKIDAALRFCAEQLDVCAEMIRDANLEPVKMNVERIGYALTYIFEIQHEIYKTHPELQPDELKNPNLNSRNKEFGSLLLQVEDLCEEGKVQVALEKLEAFILREPDEKFKEMARCHISRIKERFQV